jgi:LysR family hydrogen peroxide-inducible transcriptional activator
MFKHLAASSANTIRLWFQCLAFDIANLTREDCGCPSSSRSVFAPPRHRWDNAHAEPGRWRKLKERLHFEEGRRNALELSEIRYFIALSETLNFTKAAELCHVSQPALTRAIRKMEEELGGLLFSRERNNTHVTELGRLISPHLFEALTRANVAEQMAARFLKLEKAHLALGVMCTISPIQFVAFLGRFRADNPGIEVSLLEATPDRLSELLQKGELDIALMARPSGFPVNLVAKELYLERFVIACAAGHRFALRDSIPVADLDGEFYLQRINCEFSDMLAEICLKQDVKLIHSYRSEREDWILTMVAAGFGICFLPEYTAVFPGVVPCQFVLPSLERRVCLVSVSGRRQSRPVAAFVNAVRRYPWPSPGNAWRPASPSPNLINTV